MGRPPYWTDERRREAQQRVCDLVAETDVSLDKLCREHEDLPSHTTVYEWIQEDEAFAEKYARAREIQAHRMAADVLAIADEPIVSYDVGENGGERERRLAEAASRADMERRRQRIDARKWAASKLAPKSYGDRLQIDGDMSVKMTDDQLESRLAKLLGKAGAGAAAGRTGAPGAPEEIPSAVSGDGASKA